MAKKKKIQIPRVCKHFKNYEEFEKIAKSYFKIRITQKEYMPKLMRSSLAITPNQLGLVTISFNRTSGDIDLCLELASRQNYLCKKKVIKQKNSICKKEKEYIAYDTYINSDRWHRKRDAVLAKIKSCALCNCTPKHIHHRTYRNLGNETINDDIIPLCRNCHKLFHDNHIYDKKSHTFHLIRSKDK